MLRIILIGLVLLLTVTVAFAVLLFQQFGWMGMIAFPFILTGLAWISKIIIGQLIRNFIVKALSIKSEVLHLANLTIHSVKSVPKPPIVIEVFDADATGEAAADSNSEDEESNEGPKKYVEVELTITPQAGKNASLWEPAELTLMERPVSSLLELERVDAIGTVQDVRIWEDGRFTADDRGKYPGEQKLCVTFEVQAGSRKAVVQYYNNALGEIEFPSSPFAGGTIVDV